MSRRSDSSPIWTECKNCLNEQREFQIVSIKGDKTIFRCTECGNRVSLTGEEIERLTIEVPQG
jgi:uncharacterized Zn finger protein